MLSYRFLFDIALILLSTKLLGLVTRKFQMPQVVGALLAGLILGPAILNILHETEFIKQIAELGVIVLMFTAGLETDINELKKTGKASFIIAAFGVVIPLIGGYILAEIFNVGTSLQNIFIGVILTATSVSITVETLKELGKLSTEAGNTILGAALIDDILGIIALTVVTSMADDSVNIGLVILKIVLFFVIAISVGYIFYYYFNKLTNKYSRDMRRFVIIAFVFCLLLSFVAEAFFGVADITGAFIAGLVVSNLKIKDYIISRFETTAYMLLSPTFFASIGISVVIPELSSTIIVFSIALFIMAILSKVLGCALGAKISRLDNKESLQIGVGMISRGEVALIIASKGIALGLLTTTILAPIILTVVGTTIITPILLKIVFKGSTQIGKENELVQRYDNRVIQSKVNDISD